MLAEYLQTKFQELHEHAKDSGLELIAVGGLVRDYLMRSQIGDDVDFEIKALASSDEQDFLDQYERFKTLLIESYQIKELMFGVIQIKSNDGIVLCEIAPARGESFNEELGHDNFSVKFIPDAPFNESWKRRDFTINAIGIDSFGKLVDPFGGQTHLENKILVPCDEETFFKDPVRFLRTIRFSMKFNFEISETVLQKINQFDLSTISLFHLMKEGFKSNHLFQFFDLISGYSEQVKLSDSLKQIIELKAFKDQQIENRDQLEKFIAENSIEEQVDGLIQQGLVSKKRIQKMKRSHGR